MRNLIEQHFPVYDEELLRTLEEHAKIEHVKRGEVLIRNGEMQEKLPILLSGVYRGYILDNEGHDVTDCFACVPGDVIMGCSALGDPSRVNVEVVVEGDILMLPLEDILNMLENSRDMMLTYNQMLLDALSRHWELKVLLLRSSAMTRYQWFLRKFPGLIDHVSNKHVASFLGMTPVTLSRLRQRLKDTTGSTSGLLTDPPRRI